MTLTAPATVAGKPLPAGATVEVAEPRAGRLAERGRASYAQASPVIRAELVSGRPELPPPDPAPE